MPARAGRRADPVHKPFLHIPVPWVYVLGFLLGMGLQAAFPLRIDSAATVTALNVCGGIMFLLGAALAGWSWWLFRRAGTTAVPGEAAHVLVTGGPYRLTRNPMYAGLVVAYLGEAVSLVQPWTLPFLVLVVAYVNWYVIPVEEQTLSGVPGYADYRAGVRRWL